MKMERTLSSNVVIWFLGSRYLVNYLRLKKCFCFLHIFGLHLTAFFSRLSCHMTYIMWHKLKHVTWPWKSVHWRRLWDAAEIHAKKTVSSFLTGRSFTKWGNYSFCIWLIYCVFLYAVWCGGPGPPGEDPPTSVRDPGASGVYPGLTETWSKCKCWKQQILDRSVVYSSVKCLREILPKQMQINLTIAYPKNLNLVFVMLQGPFQTRICKNK